MTHMTVKTCGTSLPATLSLMLEIKIQIVVNLVKVVKKCRMLRNILSSHLDIVEPTVV